MVFQQVVQRLIDLGFYEFFLPFILVAAISYAVLRKTKVLGESATINGIISMALAFFIFGLPVLSGVSLVKPLTSFFGSIWVVMLILVGGMLIASFFVPDLTSRLVETMKGGGMIWWMIVIALVIGIISGLFGFITRPIALIKGGPLKDLIIVFSFLFIAFIIIAIVAGTRGGGGK